MKVPFLQSILENRLYVMLLAAVIGIFVARLIYDTVSTHDRKMRPLLIGSVVNISLLALIWACENAFQSSGWFPAAVAWIPQESFLPLSIVLIVIAIIRRNALCTWINGFAAVFVGGILMGAHFTSPAAVPQSETVTAMTIDVDHWKDGAKPVADTIVDEKPTVVCLQDSQPDGGAGQPLEDLRKALPGYHFIHDGQMTIGSIDKIEERSSTPLSPGPSDSPALVATVYGKNRPFTVVDFCLMPCDTSRAMHDPTGYFAQFTHDRDAQSKALLNAVESLHGPVLACGDFNGPPQVSGSQILSKKLQDAFEQSGTGYGFTAPANVPIERTDRVLVSAGVTASSVSTQPTTALTHLPVLAQVQIPTEMSTAQR